MQRMRIRLFREMKGMTREELAEKVGIPVEELFDYENHYKSPALNTAISIAEALGVTLAELVRGV